MNRIILVYLAASTWMAGCSSDETLRKNSPDPITFKNVFVETGTRSGELNTSNLNTFYVSAVLKTAEKQEFTKVFDNQPVTRREATWTYSPDKYWFNGDYCFIAFSHKEDSKADAPLPEDLSTFNENYSMTFNNEAYGGKEDLIYAKEVVTDATETRTEEVRLSFQHALARVMFSFENSLGNGLLTVKVPEIQTSFSKKGVFSFHSGEWTPEENGFTPAFTIDDAATNNQAIRTDYFYLIPETATTATFTVEIYNDQKLVKSQTFTSSLGTDLKKGYSYRFHAVIDQEALSLNKITFNPTVEAWNETQTQDIVQTQQTQPSTKTEKK